MNVSPLPKLNYYQERVLRLRQKREELVKTRDRFNQRIENIDREIVIYEHEASPEVMKKRRQFWEDMRKDD